MADDNPTLYGCRSDLATGREQLGQLLKETGRLAEAEAEYRAAVLVRRKLVGESPGVNSWRELAFTQARLGRLLKDTGRSRVAEAEYRAALAILKELVRRNPGVPVYRDDLAGGHTNLGDVVRSLGRPAEARDAYDQAIALREALFREAPTVATYRGHLADSLRRRGLARADLGDPAGAADDAHRALGLYDGLPFRVAEERYETACCHAALAGLAGEARSRISAGSAPVEADQAMEQLRRAVAMGHYLSLDALRNEPALGALRRRDDFRLLMIDLAMPAEPFAPAR
jgi:tetratricopeptide (TPR) repeat protein